MMNVLTRLLVRSRYVRVVDLPADETFESVHCYVGRIGRVVGYSAEGDLADVGDSPDDPAFRVEFAPGYGLGVGEGLFWSEELEPVRVPTWRGRRARPR